MEYSKVFVLHQRPYRETSAIVDFLSEQHGRVSMVCRGLRGQGKPSMAMRANMQPFAELSVSFSGKSELKTLRSVEALQAVPALPREHLYAALYLNELLLRLGRGNEFCAAIYHSYRSALAALRQACDASDAAPGDAGEQAGLIEMTLRRFEFSIMETMGFGLDFTVTCDTHEPIEAGSLYQYVAGQGFSAARAGVGEETVARKAAQGVDSSASYAVARQPLLAQGSVLQAIARGDLQAPEPRRFAKRLTRVALQPLLGEQPLRTRQLYS